MQTLFPVQLPQLLLMPHPSEPQVRPLQFGTHPGGGLGGFGSLSLSLSGFFFFFFFFLRLAFASSPMGSISPRFNKSPSTAATRAVAPRRESVAPSARVSRSNCPSSTARHLGWHPRATVSLQRIRSAIMPESGQVRLPAEDHSSSLDSRD